MLVGGPAEVWGRPVGGEDVTEGRDFKLGPTTQVGLRFHVKTRERAEKFIASGWKKRVSQGPYEEGAVPWGIWREPTSLVPLTLWETGDKVSWWW